MSENGPGMEQLGHFHEKGFSILELEEIGKKFEEMNGKIEKLEIDVNGEKAMILVLRNGVDVLMGENKKNEMFDELRELKWDKQKYMRGRVVNSRARYNLCFSNEYRDSDYENKKGTIISYGAIPLCYEWKKKIEKLVSNSDLEMEGNYYFDIKKCYIGFHGDGERKKVIGGNFSNCDRQIVWRKYKNSKIISEDYKIILKNGDIYIMSELASGFNWKKRKIETLRHAAGCIGSKIFDIKKK